MNQPLIEVATVTERPEGLDVQSRLEAIRKRVNEFAPSTVEQSSSNTPVPMLVMGDYIFNVNHIRSIQKHTETGKIEITFDGGSNRYIIPTDLDETWDALLDFAGGR